jgi:hypothetical protein
MYTFWKRLAGKPDGELVKLLGERTEAINRMEAQGAGL